MFYINYDHVWPTTHTLSLTMREAGKLIMSETDIKGMN